MNYERAAMYIKDAEELAQHYYRCGDYRMFAVKNTEVRTMQDMIAQSYHKEDVAKWLSAEYAEACLNEKDPISTARADAIYLLLRCVD